MAATNRHKQIDNTVACALMTSVATAYQTREYVKMGRRPKRSAIVEKTSAPTNNPAKVPNAKVARSGRPNGPAWPLWKIPANTNAGARRLVSAISYISKKAPNEMRATQDHRVPHGGKRSIRAEIVGGACRVGINPRPPLRNLNRHERHELLTPV